MRTAAIRMPRVSSSWPSCSCRQGWRQFADSRKTAWAAAPFCASCSSLTVASVSQQYPTRPWAAPLSGRARVSRQGKVGTKFRAPGPIRSERRCNDDDQTEYPDGQCPGAPCAGRSRIISDDSARTRRAILATSWLLRRTIWLCDALVQRLPKPKVAGSRPVVRFRGLPGFARIRRISPPDLACWSDERRGRPKVKCSSSRPEFRATQHSWRGLGYVLATYEAASGRVSVNDRGRLHARGGVRSAASVATAIRPRRASDASAADASPRTRKRHSYRRLLANSLGDRAVKLAPPEIHTLRVATRHREYSHTVFPFFADGVLIRPLIAAHAETAAL